MNGNEREREAGSIRVETIREPKSRELPPRDVMYDALVRRDASFEGVFVVGVQSTGIACRPTCPARKPKPNGVEYFATVREALLEGYRPCKRCRPLEPAGAVPEWLRPVIELVERDPSRRVTDQDLRELALEPARVRRWFSANHGMTFHAYARSRRLGLALGTVGRGEDLAASAHAHGFESLSGFREAFARFVGEPAGRTAARARVRARTGDAPPAPLHVTRIPTALGPMVAAASDEGVALLEFADRRGLETQIRTLARRAGGVPAPGSHRWLEQLTAELDEYFAGSRLAFEVPLWIAGTPFQESVWSELRAIPPGETRSYDAIARAIGRPTAVRAVGKANGDNRLAILVPCHRVVGKDGRLTGYAGGLWRKRRLLELERKPPFAEARATERSIG